MKCLVLLICLIPMFHPVAAQQNASFPGDHWQQYVDVADAGFSAGKLDSVKFHFEKSPAAGLFIVHRGRVLAAWGDINRRFRMASVRKSLMSGLYGAFVARGRIDLGQTLAALKIDDLQPLSQSEKEATVEHLLAAKSGVYHPAAYSPRNMAANLPGRGTQMPGTFWYYNNWDFNTLATIFKRETGSDVFEAFLETIARPLQMEDFRLQDTYYRYEPEKSRHPAYLFRMTARDLARFGWLYASKGDWRGTQIIPDSWVEKTTTPVTTETGRYSGMGSYGYLWWVSPPVNGERMFFASGSGGQKLCVLPDAELVIAHVVDSYQGRSVSHENMIALIENILETRTAPASASPALRAYQAPPRQHPPFVKVTPEVLDRYEGEYKHPFLGTFGIRRDGDKLSLQTQIGTFDVFPVSENTFWPVDIESVAEFTPAETDVQKLTIRPVFGQNRTIVKTIFYY